MFSAKMALRRFSTNQTTRGSASENKNAHTCSSPSAVREFTKYLGSSVVICQIFSPGIPWPRNMCLIAVAQPSSILQRSLQSVLLRSADLKTLCYLRHKQITIRVQYAGRLFIIKLFSSLIAIQCCQHNQFVRIYSIAIVLWNNETQFMQLF